MLCTHLAAANSALEQLIAIILQDLEDIKVANHDEIFARLESKNALIAAFGEHKKDADLEMRKLLARFPNKKIEELLDGNAMNLIDKMRESLKELKSLNKQYARFALAVSEFYNSLVEAILPSQKSHYYDKSHAAQNLVSIKA